MKNAYLLICLIFIFLSSMQGQDSIPKPYYPKGDPKKWNVELTPFLWLPWIHGEIGLGKLEKRFDATPIDILKNLRGAFLFHFDVSRGRFITGASYTYMKLATEKVLLQNRNGKDVLVSIPELPMHLLNYMIGTRVKAGTKVLIDPFVGFRYVNLHPSIEVNNLVTSNTNQLQARLDFWDPVLGVRLNYFPHPRVPLTLYTDIGGFSAGSKISWTTGLKAGYSAFTWLDIFGGFHAFGFNYEQVNLNGRTSSMRTVLFGFEAGCSFMLPKRTRDPALYKVKND